MLELLVFIFLGIINSIAFELNEILGLIITLICQFILITITFGYAASLYGELSKKLEDNI